MMRVLNKIKYTSKVTYVAELISPLLKIFPLCYLPTGSFSFSLSGCGPCLPRMFPALVRTVSCGQMDPHITKRLLKDKAIFHIIPGSPEDTRQPLETSHALNVHRKMWASFMACHVMLRCIDIRFTCTLIYYR